MRIEKEEEEDHLDISLHKHLSFRSIEKRIRLSSPFTRSSNDELK
jgi:hypothetical protein